MPTGQVAGLLDKLQTYWMRTGPLDKLQAFWGLLDEDRSTGQVAGFLGPIGVIWDLLNNWQAN